MGRKTFVKTVLGVLLLGMAGLGTDRAYAQSGAAANGQYNVYVGTYTGPKSKGVFGYRFDAKTGNFTPLGLVAEVASPSFVAVDPGNKFLYALTERGNGPPSPETRQSFLSSYAIDPGTGALKFLNKVSAQGNTTAHLAVDHSGKTLFAANYGSGTITSFALLPDGSIGDMTGTDQHTGSSVDPKRQEGPHPHEVVLSPDNRFLFVPDLGLDKIMSYRVLAEKSSFELNEPPYVRVNPGLGPRHLAFGKDAKFAYVVCEMGSSVVAFSYDSANGKLAAIQTISNLPPDFKGVDNSGEIGIDSSGRHLYASNRGDDSITVYDIDPRKGTLTRAQVAHTGGKTPRNFVIDPTGKLLLAANQDSDTITILNIDQKTGELTPANRTLDVPSPVDILFVPAK
jgi:6-phosphogluconolactonase